MMIRLIRFVIRNLRQRLARTILTLFGIVLGVAVILAISITNESTLASIDAVFNEASGKAHLVIESAQLTGEGFDQGVLSRVQSTEGVQVAVPSIQVRTLLASQADQWQLALSIAGAADGEELLLYGIDPAVDDQAREYRMVAGDFLAPDDDAYNVVLVEEFAGDNDLQIGDDLEILTPNGSEEMRVVGLIAKEGPGGLNNGDFGVVPLAALQDIFDRGSNLDVIDVVAESDIAKNSAQLEALKARLEDRLGEDYTVSFPATRGKFVSQLLATYQQGLGFFSATALFVGAFLIYNTFSMTIVERTREIGMLRALGATRRQVLALILAEAILLGSLGSALGVMGGMGLARGLIGFMGTVTGFEVPETTIPASGLLTSLIVGGLVTLVSALWPAYRASTITPIQALRILGQSGEGALVRWGWLPGSFLIVLAYLALYVIPLRTEAVYPVGSTSIFVLLLGATLVVPVTVSFLERFFRPFVTALYSSEGRLGGSNVSRSKSRTTLTVAALMVGIAMIIGLQGITSSLQHDMTVWVDTAIGGDLYVRSPLPLRRELQRRLEAEEGVAVVSPVRYFSVKRAVPPDEDEDTLVFVAVEPETYTKIASFVFDSGQGESDALIADLAQGDAIFVSTVVAEKWGLERGDTLRLETRRGERDYRVAAVIVDFLAQGYVVTGTWKDMRRDFGLSDVSVFNVKLTPEADLDEVRQRLADRYGQRWHVQLESREEFQGRIQVLRNQATGLLNVLGLISMIVAALGVINTLVMNVLERQREIGMLRGLGMTRWQVAKMILAEAGMLGAIGGVFGLAFGLFLSRVFIMALNDMGSYTLDYTLPLMGVIASIIIALVVTQVAALYPARMATRVNIVEAIQHE